MRNFHFLWTLKPFFISVFAFFFLFSSVQALDWQKLKTKTNLQAAYWIQDKKRANFQVILYINAGEADMEGPEGRAHYLEHLVAINALEISGDTLVSAEGNAATSMHWTRYHQVSDQEGLESAIQRLSRVFEPDLITGSKRDQDENTIVLREHGLRTKGRPLITAFKQFNKAMHANTYLARDVLGEPEGIKNFNLAQARDDFKLFHHPNNSWVLVITPPGDHRQTLENLISTAFGAFEAGPPLKPIVGVAVEPETLPHQRFVNPQGTTRQLHVSRFHAVAPFLDRPPQDRLHEIYARDLVSDWLNGRLKGSLAKTFVSETSMLTNVGIDVYRSKDFIEGLWLFAEFNTGMDHEEVQTQLFDHLNRLAEQGMPEDIFKRLQKRRFRSEKRAFKNAPRHEDLVTRFALQREVPPTADEVLQAYESLTVEQINASLRGLLGGQNRQGSLFLYAKDEEIE